MTNQYTGSEPGLPSRRRRWRAAAVRWLAVASLVAVVPEIRAMEEASTAVPAAEGSAAGPAPSSPAAPAAAGVEENGPPSPAEILERLAATPGERVRFTEQRSNALLSEPMSLAGYVELTADGTLIRVVEEPFDERATIDGEEATLERDGRRRTVDLGRRGRGVAYLRSLYALLRGDVAVLQQAFDMAVEGTAGQWTLTLTPTEDSLERRLAQIVVRGSGERTAGIRMERSDGAWQDMQLRPGP